MQSLAWAEADHRRWPLHAHHSRRARHSRHSQPCLVATVTPPLPPVESHSRRATARDAAGHSSLYWARPRLTALVRASDHVHVSRPRRAWSIQVDSLVANDEPNPSLRLATPNSRLGAGLPEQEVNGCEPRAQATLGCATSGATMLPQRQPQLDRSATLLPPEAQAPRLVSIRDKRARAR